MSTYNLGISRAKSLQLKPYDHAPNKSIKYNVGLLFSKQTTLYLNKPFQEKTAVKKL